MCNMLKHSGQVFLPYRVTLPRRAMRNEKKNRKEDISQALGRNYERSKGATER